MTQWYRREEDKIIGQMLRDDQTKDIKQKPRKPKVRTQSVRY